MQVWQMQDHKFDKVITKPSVANQAHSTSSHYWPSCLRLHPCIVVRPESSDNSFISIGDSINLVVEAVVEEVYYAIKRHSLQIRREGDDANVIF